MHSLRGGSRSRKGGSLKSSSAFCRAGEPRSVHAVTPSRRYAEGAAAARGRDPRSSAALVPPGVPPSNKCRRLSRLRRGPGLNTRDPRLPVLASASPRRALPTVGRYSRMTARTSAAVTTWENAIARVQTPDDLKKPSSVSGKRGDSETGEELGLISGAYLATQDPMAGIFGQGSQGHRSAPRLVCRLDVPGQRTRAAVAK